MLVLVYIDCNCCVMTINKNKQEPKQEPKKRITSILLDYIWNMLLYTLHSTWHVHRSTCSAQPYSLGALLSFFLRTVVSV